MNNFKGLHPQKKTVCVLATLLAATIVTALAFMIAFIVTLSNQTGSSSKWSGDHTPKWPAPSKSQLGKFTKAAIAADNGVCSEIGRDIMIKGGNAVDAAIAATFCIGVMDPHSAGIGGGHFTTIYNKTTKSCFIIDARESAPASASRDMFANVSVDVAARGWRSIAIPGEVYGLRKAYDLAGSRRIGWYDLLKPAIDLCRNGYVVSGSLANAIREKTEFLMEEATIKDLFYNNETNQMYQTGEVMKRPVLAATLEELAKSPDPIQLFYRGAIKEKLMQDFKDNNVNITAEDFANYKALYGPSQRPAITAEIAGTNLIACGPPPPSSAAIAISVLKIMSQFNITSASLDHSIENNVETYHRLIEAMKYAYAAREHLGDMDFLPNALSMARNFTSDAFVEQAKQQIGEMAKKNITSYYIINEPTGEEVAEDHGTAHISVLDAEGNAVSITSTINLYLGSFRRSVSTDIIWNDDMDDFSTPGSDNSFGYEPVPSNYIEPGKRPLSSMAPIVLFDKDSGDVKVVAGAAGGSRIISSTINAVIRLLWFGENVKEAIDAPRLHNQLHPISTEYEEGFPKLYEDQLKSMKGQNMSLATDMAAVNIVHRTDDFIYANSDYRKDGGYPAGH